MLTAIVFAASAVASPTPAASSLPFIVHVHTAAACQALRTLSLPVGYIAKRDDDAFVGIDVAMIRFVGGFDAFDAPTASQLAAAVGETPQGDETPQQATDSAGEESQDDAVTYNGQSILSAARIDAIAEQVTENLTLADSYMAKSWKQYPKGKDPAIDALRQRAQNLIDLQRALAARYEEFAGTYLDNMGNASLVPDGQRTSYKALLRAFVLGEAADDLNPEAAVPGSARPLPEVSELKKTGAVADLVRELRRQEAAFTPSVVSEFRYCRK